MRVGGFPAPRCEPNDPGWMRAAGNVAGSEREDPPEGARRQLGGFAMYIALSPPFGAAGLAPLSARGVAALARRPCRPLQFEPSARAALSFNPVSIDETQGIRLDRSDSRRPTAPDGRPPLPRPIAESPRGCCQRNRRGGGETTDRDAPGAGRHGRFVYSSLKYSDKELQSIAEKLDARVIESRTFHLPYKHQTWIITTLDRP